MEVKDMMWTKNWYSYYTKYDTKQAVNRDNTLQTTQVVKSEQAPQSCEPAIKTNNNSELRHQLSWRNMCNGCIFAYLNICIFEHLSSLLIC